MRSVWQAAEKPRREDVKKSTNPVILSGAKDLQLFVIKKTNADPSLHSG